MFTDNTENTFIAIILIAEFYWFCQQAWPARSLHFTPLDFFYGWHMKDMVTQGRSLTREELLQKIVEFTDCIDEMMKLPNSNRFLIRIFSV